MRDFDSNDEDAGIGPITAEGKASEDKLATLHGVVAEFLTLKLSTGKATAAEVGAAIAFLKNNSITADPGTNEKLNNLSRVLAEKKRGKLTRAQMTEANEHFDSLMGGMGLPQ